MANSIWHTSFDGKNIFHFGNNSSTWFASQDSYFFQNSASTNVVSIDGSGNLGANSQLTATLLLEELLQVQQDIMVLILGL